MTSPEPRNVVLRSSDESELAFTKEAVFSHCGKAVPKDLLYPTYKQLHEKGVFVVHLNNDRYILASSVLLLGSKLLRIKVTHDENHKPLKLLT